MELQVLAGLLAHPQGDALETLKEWSRSHPWLAEAVAELERIPLDQWQGEHTRLFLNGFPRTLAPPFMSAWNEGQMVGQGVWVLEQVYSQAGLESVDGMPGDYLGTLLAFTAHLAAHPQPPGEMDADTFKKTFIQPWIHRFIDALQQGSELALYRLLAARLRTQLA